MKQRHAQKPLLNPPGANHTACCNIVQQRSSTSEKSQHSWESKRHSVIRCMMKNIENDAYGHFPYLIAVRIRDISGSDKNNVIYPQCTKCSEHNFLHVRNHCPWVTSARSALLRTQIDPRSVTFFNIHPVLQ